MLIVLLLFWGHGILKKMLPWQLESVPSVQEVEVTSHYVSGRSRILGQGSQRTGADMLLSPLTSLAIGPVDRGRRLGVRPNPPLPLKRRVR
jgi:hypothetical protein